jgi:hypothetical protein
LLPLLFLVSVRKSDNTTLAKQRSEFDTFASTPLLIFSSSFSRFPRMLIAYEDDKARQMVCVDAPMEEKRFEVLLLLLSPFSS